MKLFNLIIIFVCLQLTACSYFFPDKEKDYVYSKEISALEIPPELQTNKKIPKNLDDELPQSLAYQVELLSEDGAFLRVNSSFAHVWRIVAKALTELSIEVTDKNREKALYYVQYDPELQASEKDGSYWQEMVFMFGGDVHQELPYQIFLSVNDKGSDIFVRDETGKQLSEGKGLQLLTLLFDTMNNKTPNKENKE